MGLRENGERILRSILRIILLTFFLIQVVQMMRYWVLLIKKLLHKQVLLLDVPFYKTDVRDALFSCIWIKLGVGWP